MHAKAFFAVFCLKDFHALIGYVKLCLQNDHFYSSCSGDCGSGWSLYLCVLLVLCAQGACCFSLRLIQRYDLENTLVLLRHLSDETVLKVNGHLHKIADLLQ